MAKANASSSTNLVSLFTDLSKCEQSGDFEKGVKLCNKILNADKNSVKAKQCKVICYIQLGKIEEALKEIGRSVYTDVRPLLIFEKAYCEYKLNRIDECLQTLSTIDNFGLREKELQAQALYRKEQFLNSYQTYADLIRNSSDDYEQERMTNLVAAVACLTWANDPSIDSIPNVPLVTFEQHYNQACRLLGEQKVQQALNHLEQSENVCKQTLDEEGATEEEIESELNLIRAQVAYAYQCIGKDKEALEIYNQVLKQKPSDNALISVINNNIIAINQDQNIFDTKKRIKTAITELTAAKLLNIQKSTILLNNATVQLQTGQNSLCRDQLNEYRESNLTEDDSQRFLLIEVALLKKEKKFDEAKKLLQQTIDQTNSLFTDKLELILILGQILLEQKDLQGFADLFHKYDFLSAHIGVVSTAVAIQLNAQNRAAAMQILNNAIAWYRKNQPDNSKNLIILHRELSRLLNENNQKDEMIEVLEELRRLVPKDPRVISQLIRAYSVVNIEKARQICKELPIIEEIIQSVDVDSIESSNWSGGSKYIKKTGKSETVDKKVAKNGQIVADKKRKRKRKTKLPKNFDPNFKPDPERWLPKWQRSTYKKRKNDRKHNVGKGTQGAVGGVETTETAYKQSPRPAKTSPMPALSRQQRAQKKKKGGRR